MKLKSKNLLGAIIAICAIGMMATKYFTNGNFDSDIMPFILMWLAVIVFFAKPQKEGMRIELNKRQKNVILTVVSVTLIAGIAAFFVTLF